MNSFLKIVVTAKLIQDVLCVKFIHLPPVDFDGDPVTTDWESSGDPIVYSSHPISRTWKVFDLSINEFLSQFDTLENVYISTNKYFTFFDEGKIEKSIFRKNFSQPFNFTSMAGTDFFKNLPVSKSDVQTYRYFFGRVSGHLFENARPYMEPSLVPQKSGNLWMSMKNSQMPTHYDNLHNVYIQLYGKKRFRLFPHTVTGSLCVHGRLHPHGRQTRFRDLSFPDKLVPPTFSDLYRHDTAVSEASDRLSLAERDAEVQRRCSLSEAEGLEVVLSPGNILSLPPYWYHETRSEENSISLSVWLNATAEGTYMAAVYDYPIPFDFTWSRRQMYHAGLLYMSLVCRQVELLIGGSVASPRARAREVAVDGTEKITERIADGTLLRSSTLVMSVEQLLKNRYVEDLLLDDSDYREGEFGKCACANSDISASNAAYLQTLLPNLDWQWFQNSSETLASLLLRVRHSFVPSELEPQHAAAVVMTKTTDFVEDFFHHISHQEGRNLVAIISEWTKCRHKNFLNALSVGGC